MNQKKSILKVILSTLGGWLIFLLLLALVNIFAIGTDNLTFQLIIQFINDNLGLILLYSVIFFLGELFSCFMFPLNLPSPIFNAAGSIYLVFFIFEVLNLVMFLNFGSVKPLIPIMNMSLVLVPIIVLIVGYFNIFMLEMHKHKKRKKR